MRCPFLKESTTRFCQAAPDRKIPSAGISTPDELCSTPEYTKCAVAQANQCDHERKASCPYLSEMLAQYCAAAPVVKFIPFTERESRCTTDAHHYCPLFLQRAHPGQPVPVFKNMWWQLRKERALARAAPDRRPLGPAETTIAPATPGGRRNGKTLPAPRPVRSDIAHPGIPDVQVLEHLSYAPNHMWIDIAADRTCHVGLDAFAARILGCVDRVRFLRSTGLLCPAVSLEVNQVDLAMVFPRRILVTGCNAHLRTDPTPLESDPYGAGWLFSGTYVDELAGSADLIEGSQSAAWMQSEVDRMQHFVHDELPHSLPNGAATAMDGGMFEAGLAQRLDHESLLRLYGSFLAPNMSWRRS